MEKLMKESVKTETGLKQSKDNYRRPIPCNEMHVEKAKEINYFGLALDGHVYIDYHDDAFPIRTLWIYPATNGHNGTRRKSFFSTIQEHFLHQLATNSLYLKLHGNLSVGEINYPILILYIMRNVFIALYEIHIGGVLHYQLVHNFLSSP